MNRLKFLLFAVLACGVWAYGLMSAGPAFGARQAELAATTLAGVPSAVALAVEAQRSALGNAAHRAAAHAFVGAKPAKVEAPAQDRIDQLRTAAAAELSDAQRGQLLVGVFTEAGGRWVTGAGEAQTDAPAGVDVAALGQANGPAAVAVVGGQAQVLFALPLQAVDKADLVRVGTVVFGLPLLPDAAGFAGGLVKDFQLEAVSLAVAGGAPAVAGSDKALLEKTAALQAGAVKAVAEGPVGSLGPLKFPMFGASQAQAFGLKQALGGAPVEVVAVTSVKPALEALAGFQRFALLGLLAMLLLAGAVLALLSEGSAPAMSVTAPSLPAPPMPVPSPRAAMPAAPAAAAPAPVSEAPAPFEPAAAPAPAAFDPSPAAFTPAPAASEAPHAPEPAAAESFDFGMLGQVSSKPVEKAPEPPKPVPAPAPPPPKPVAAPPPAATDSAVVALPGAAPARAAPAPAAPSHAAHHADAIPLPGAAPAKKAPAPAPAPSLFDEEDARTAAYPVPKGLEAKVAADPFAAASAAMGSAGYEPDSSDSTRVAAIPQELLKAARTGGAGGADAPRPAPSAPPPRVAAAAAAPAAAFDEDRHFQDVFREFVATRERCGEPADGLTYDKFKAKLLKNKEQLVAKYACKSVRFQVYVKDNKAALKATPVKD